jgi:hypothetical protein
MTSSVAVLEDLISTPKPLVRVQKRFTIKYRIEGSDPQKEMKQISEEINSRLIPYILHANINDLKCIFQKYMPIFGSKLKKLNSSMISIVEHKNDLLKIAQSEYEMYESLKKTLRLGIDPNYAEQLTQFFDNLRDYENILFGIVINRLDNLKESLKKVNIDDLKNNTYGGFLAFVYLRYLGHRTHAINIR